MRESEAPGLLRVKRPNGSIEYHWSASRACKRAEVKAYRPRTFRLRANTEAGRATECCEYTAELLAWLAEQGRPGGKVPFTGTVKSLDHYCQTGAESPLQRVSYATRQTYLDESKVLVSAVGDRRIDRITGSDLVRWHANFAKPVGEGEPRLRRAQGAMKHLRRITSWGVQERLPGCKDLAAILAEARFEMPAAREYAPSYEQVVAFIAAAHALNRPVFALAAALMFDTSLRQTDVIGKWVPDDSAKGQGGFVHNGRRWTSGLLWQDIAADGELSKRMSKNGARGKFDMNKCPLVLAAIAEVPEERRVGPMIFDHINGRPYRHRWFAALWRRIARRAGIPDAIWSRDTRAAAITDAFDAGAELEHVRQMATHSDPKVTGRYNRGSTTQTSQVADLRAAHRARGTK